VTSRRLRPAEAILSAFRLFNPEFYNVPCHINCRSGLQSSRERTPCRLNLEWTGLKCSSMIDVSRFSPAAQRPAYGYEIERRVLAHNVAHSCMCTPCHHYRSLCGLSLCLACEPGCVRSAQKKSAELLVRRRNLVYLNAVLRTFEASLPLNRATAGVISRIPSSLICSLLLFDWLIKILG
jgi:hypothetical protein